jgi:hypothetical protein
METNTIDVESATLCFSDIRFNLIEIVAVGCLVMFTENVSISKGAINGATAMVHEIECFNDGMVTSITVQLTDTEVKMKLKRQLFQHKNTYEAYYYRASFLPYAITGHKS